MSRSRAKYIISAVTLLAWGHMVFGTAGPVAQPPIPYDPLVPVPGQDTLGINFNAPESIVDPSRITQDPSFEGLTPPMLRPIEGPDIRINPDSIPETGRFLPDSFYEDEPEEPGPIRITAQEPTVVTDSVQREPKKLLDDIISGHNRDSLIYDLRNKKVYIYRDGDITYQDMNLKADYAEVDLETKDVYGYGYADTLGNKTRPEFREGGSIYTMDTLTYNLDSKKAKIKGAATQEGDGFLMGAAIKKMEDNTVNIFRGRYTTCDHIEHPHYYLAMQRAKLIPNEKVIIGYSYLVMEDVPIYFPGLPFGFFPITQGRKSGIIMPSFGEEYVKGFFLRDGGYYWAVNDYLDLTMLGGWYTLGSWEASLASRYIKRYHYSGGFNFRYTKTVIGEKDDDDYINSGSFSFQWTHSQDPKFRPNSSFSASVNFSSSNYSQYGTNNLMEHLNTQTNSSISYSKSWPGKPYSFSTSLNHSQNSQTKRFMLSFPNVNFNVSTIYPFKSKNFVGKEKWYHKISFRYTGTFANDVNVEEKDLFTDVMWKSMSNGLQHQLPVSASFSVFNYLNLTPNFTYTERWNFRKITKDYDPITETRVAVDTTYGFYRVYNYSFNMSATTKIYGMFELTGPNPLIRAVRHVITPTIGVSWAPDFSKARYGFFKPIQQNAAGDVIYYSPYEGNKYALTSPPGRQMNLNFQLGNTLEAKVRNERDTTGVKKISLIDQLSFSGSYNFLADSMNLSIINMSFRTTIIKNLGLTLNATFDPYQINENGNRINKFMTKQGKLARLTSLSTSFGYNFSSGTTNRPAMNDFNNSTELPTPEDQDFFNRNDVDYNTQRMMLTSQYYDFNIPWNFGFNYTFNYRNERRDKTIQQTVSFNGSANLTEKWGVTMSGGYDFEQKKLSHMAVTIVRDLHCWQMNLSWIPIGTMQSWSFNISVKSNVLKDLKYDRRSSRYDTLFDR